MLHLIATSPGVFRLNNALDKSPSFAAGRSWRTTQIAFMDGPTCLTGSGRATISYARVETRAPRRSFMKFLSRISLRTRQRVLLGMRSEGVGAIAISLTGGLRRRRGNSGESVDRQPVERYYVSSRRAPGADSSAGRARSCGARRDIIVARGRPRCRADRLGMRGRQSRRSPALGPQPEALRLIVRPSKGDLKNPDRSRTTPARLAARLAAIRILSDGLRPDANLNKLEGRLSGEDLRFAANSRAPQITQWRSQLLDGAAGVFGRDKKLRRLWSI